MVWHEILPCELDKLRHPLIVDVRSPCEFILEKIPGAVNLPLFSDEQRAEIGTIYKVQGEQQARLLAIKIIAPKIPEIIEKIVYLRKHENSLVINCWRGGLRSEAVASVLSLAGIKCFRLAGGYKAWRQRVFTELTNDVYPFQAIIIDGLTGVGKTELLDYLEKFGAQVLDLEKLANHSGSAFGALGKGTKQPSQKDFEASIWVKLKSFDLSRPVFIEAESKRIGSLSLPSCVYTRIRNSKTILLEASIELRANRIFAQYIKSSFNLPNADINSDMDVKNHTDELLSALNMIDKLNETLGKTKCMELKQLVESGQIRDAVLILLEKYYDPLYNKSILRRALANSYEMKLKSNNMTNCVQEILDWAKNNYKN